MIFSDFDTLVNSNRPQDKRFRGTRFFLGHIDHVPRGLTVSLFFRGGKGTGIIHTGGQTGFLGNILL